MKSKRTAAALAASVCLCSCLVIGTAGSALANTCTSQNAAAAQETAAGQTATSLQDPTQVANARHAAFARMVEAGADNTSTAGASAFIVSSASSADLSAEALGDTGTYYPITTVDQLVDYLKQGGNCRLDQDITITREYLLSLTASGYSIPITGTCNIDFNDHSIYIGAAGESIGYADGSVHPVFVVKNGGSCTLTRAYEDMPTQGGIQHTGDGTLEAPLFSVETGGTLTLRHRISGISSDTSFPDFALADTGGLILVKGGTFTIDSGNISNCNNAGYDAVVRVASGTFNFTSGVIEHCSLGRACGSDWSSFGIVTLGTFSGDYDATGTAAIAEKASIRYCSATVRAYAISVLGKGTVNFAGTISNCTFKSDDGYGGAVSVQQNGTFNMTGGIIASCESGGKGAAAIVGSRGAYSEGGPTAAFNMSGGTIARSNYTTQQLGQVYVDSAGGFTLSGTAEIQAHNTNTNTGGCVYVGYVDDSYSQGFFTMSGGSLVGPSSTSNPIVLYKGGCLYNAGCTEITGGTISGGTCSALQGGLIYQERGTMTIKGCTLQNGKAVRDANKNYGFGGGIYVQSGWLRLGDETATVQNCSATAAGGGIYQETGTVELRGGAIVSSCKALPSSSSSSAYATYGGGIYSKAGTLRLYYGARITNCIVAEDDDDDDEANVSEDDDIGYGGGIYAKDTAIEMAGSGMPDFQIDNCTATYGGGMCIDTASNQDSRLIDLEGGDIFSNTALADGGGIYIAQGADPVRLACTIYKNTANGNGGGVYAKGTDLTINGIGASSNTAGKKGGGMCIVPADTSTGKAISVVFKDFFAFYDNSSKTTTYKNVYLDYLGTTSRTPATCAINTSYTGSSDVGSAPLSIDPEALSDGSTEARTLFTGTQAWTDRARFPLEQSGQCYVTESGGARLCVAKDASLISDAAGYKAAVMKGGWYYLTSDIDLTGIDVSSIRTITKNLNISLMGHWITADTTRGSFAIVKDGITFNLGTADPAGTAGFDGGGLRSTATADNYIMGGYSPAVVVEPGGTCNIVGCNLQGLAISDDTAAPVAQVDGTGSAQATLAVNHAKIQNCFSVYQGAISATGPNASVSVLNSTVNGAVGAKMGTCLFIDSGTTSSTATTKTQIAISDSTLNGVDGADYGGCLYLGANSTSAIANSTFAGATVKNNGGAIYVKGSQAQVTQAATADVTVRDGTFTGGTAVNGGAICAELANLTVSSTTLISGATASESGGGIYWHLHKQLLMPVASCTGTLKALGRITNCQAENGGAICVDITGNRVIGDVTLDGALENNSAANGGAIYVTNSGSQAVAIGRGLIQNNTASALGGGLYVEAGPVSIEAAITGNTASIGAGVYLGEASSETKASLLSSAQITNNKASEKGGGLYVDDAYLNEHVALAGNASIIDNTAGSSDAPSNLYIDASIQYQTATPFPVTLSTFTGTCGLSVNTEQLLGGIPIAQGTDSDLAYFTSDNSSEYTVVYNTSATYDAPGIWVQKAAANSGSGNVSPAVDIADATVTYDKTIPYTALPAKPQVAVTDDGYALIEDADYTLTYPDNAVEVGDYAFTVTGIGSYEGTQTCTYSIGHSAKIAAFTDLDADAWYLGAGGTFANSRTLYLDYVLETGLMSGYADSSRFGPEDTLTRAQAATILFRHACPDQAVQTTDPGQYSQENTTDLPDVKTGQYYTAAVNWAVEQGIFTGYGDTGLFDPDGAITREQLATILYRLNASAQERAEKAGAITFSDEANVSSWATDAVRWCASTGIVSGMGDTGRFDPQSSATRTACAKMFAVALRDVIAG